MSFLGVGRNRWNTEEDDYWSKSQIEKSTGKYNMFDDDISVDNASVFASKILSCRQYEDDDFSESLESHLDHGLSTATTTTTTATTTSSSSPFPGGGKLKNEQASLISRIGTPAKATTTTTGSSNLKKGTDYYKQPSSTPATPGDGVQSGAASFHHARTSSFGHGRSKSDTGTTGGSFSVYNTRTELSMNTSRRSSQQEGTSDYSEGSYSSDAYASIEDILQRSTPKISPAATINKLEAEVQFLRRSLKTSDRERWSRPLVTDTVKRIRDGEIHTGLFMYRTREDKLEIMDKAIESNDGNTITAVVLFLRQTLSDEVFQEVLETRPIAVNHYISHLRTEGSYPELVSFLKAMQMNEEAAMVMYKQAVCNKDLAVKFDSLKRCLREYKSHCPNMSSETWLVEQQLALLEWQNAVDSMDSKNATDTRYSIFQEVPRPLNLVTSSVIASAYYSCLYHYNNKETDFASPLHFRKKHALTEKQFLWPALAARARVKAWADVEDLLTTKGTMFTGKKIKNVVSLDKVAELLFKFGAPEDEIKKCLLAMNNNEKCLQLSQKFNCYRTFVETCVAMKDRRELENFARKFPSNSEPHRLAADALSVSTIKWK